MAHRPIDQNNDDSGRISDDPSRISSGSSSRMSPTGTPTDTKSEGKRKKFRPLDAVRKLFKRRPKLKEIDSARARSTSALYGHASGDGEDDEGGFLSRLSLRKNKSRSEDSVLVESRSNQGGILRKLAYSVEGINRSLYSSNSGKSSSRNSLNSTESQDIFKESLQAQKSAVEPTDASVDFEAVAKTEALNTDAAKFKISVRPKGRKGSRQNRHHRQKVASNLPCLSEELNTITNPSLTEDETEKMAQDADSEKPASKEDEEETGFKQEAKLRTSSTNQDVPPKPRPKSTPAIIHSTPEIKKQRIDAVLDFGNGESPKHLLNPELLEVGKIRSKSLDIDGRLPRSSDLGLSPVSKFNLAENLSKDDDGIIIRAGPSGRKSPEINNTDLIMKKNHRGFQPLDFRRTDFEARTMKFSRSCETNLNIGSSSQKRPLSSDIGDKNVKIIKSPLRSEFGLRFKQNPEDEEKVPTPIRSPVKKIDLGVWPTKSPIQTPSLESKPLSPMKGLSLGLKSISLSSDLEEETRLTKSLKPFDLGLKPVKSPAHRSDNTALSCLKSLQSPVRETEDVEFSFPKMRNENHDAKEQTDGVSELPESVQKLGENPEQGKNLQERRLENSDHSSIEETPMTDKANENKKPLQLPAVDNKTTEQKKSPRKIIANLELNNLSAKPFRSFSDPKSPRTLRSGNLSPRSPIVSPRSPILPPKPIRSPIENLDTKSTPKDFDGSKLGLKCDNISNSSENLFSKLPPSPSVPPKSFRSGQKMGPRSPSHSPKSEDVSENPLLLSVNVDVKPEISSDITKELPLKPVQLEPKPLKKAEDVITVKKPSEKPNLRPKPFKSYSEISSSDSKLNVTSIKTERSYAKPNDSQVDVEQWQSQVGKNREIFQALGNKESKVPETPKKSTGSSKRSAFVNRTESLKSTATDENPADIDKQNISPPVTQNKPKTPDFLKSADSLSTASKVANASKTDSIPDPSRKTKPAFGGYKTEESRKTVPASPKETFTSKPFSSKVTAETPKAVDGSTTLSQRSDAGPNLPSTTRSVDARKLSDPPKAIVTSKKLPSSSSLSSSKHSDGTSNEANSVATTSKITPMNTSTKEATDTKKPSKSFEVTSSASTENVATGIDVSTNNTNRLSALFEAKRVTASNVEPSGTTVKIEVVPKDDYEEQKTFYERMSP